MTNSAPLGLSPSPNQAIGRNATLALGVLLLGFALTVNFPSAAHGFQSDEATYYMLGQSLARDHDFTYERSDLERVWH